MSENETETNTEIEIIEEKVDQPVVEQDEAAIAPDETVADDATPQPEQVSDEEIITIGDEDPSADEPTKDETPQIKELRRIAREREKEIRELKRQITMSAPPPAEVEIGPEPTLESCDYNESIYQNQIKKWIIDKQDHDRKVQEKADKEKEAVKKWEDRLEQYKKLRSEIKVSNFDDVELSVQSKFSATQQGIVIQSANNPAHLFYAIGKDPERLEKLAAITDPIQFTFEIGKLEAQMKVTKKTPPQPEKIVTGGSGNATDYEKRSDQLLNEARRTGDYTKFSQFRAEMAAKGKI